MPRSKVVERDINQPRRSYLLQTPDLNPFKAFLQKGNEGNISLMGKEEVEKMKLEEDDKAELLDDVSLVQ